MLVGSNAQRSCPRSDAPAPRRCRRRASPRWAGSTSSPWPRRCERCGSDATADDAGTSANSSLCTAPFEMAAATAQCARVNAPTGGPRPPKRHLHGEGCSLVPGAGDVPLQHLSLCSTVRRRCSTLPVRRTYISSRYRRPRRNPRIRLTCARLMSPASSGPNRFHHNRTVSQPMSILRFANRSTLPCLPTSAFGFTPPSTVLQIHNPYKGTWTTY